MAISPVVELVPIKLPAKIVHRPPSKDAEDYQRDEYERQQGKARKYTLDYLRKCQFAADWLGDTPH